MTGTSIARLVFLAGLCAVSFGGAVVLTGGFGRISAVGSPEPVHLVLSHSMLGNVEPCGCGDLKLGGLDRRMDSMLGLIGSRPGHWIVADGGNLTAVPFIDSSRYAAETMEEYFRRWEPNTLLALGPSDLEWLDRPTGEPRARACMNRANGAGPTWSARGSVRVTSLVDPAELSEEDRARFIDPLRALARLAQSSADPDSIDVVFAYLSPGARERMHPLLRAQRRAMILVDCNQEIQGVHGVAELGNSLILRIPARGRFVTVFTLHSRDLDADRAFYSSERARQLAALKNAGGDTAELAPPRSRWLYSMRYLKQEGEPRHRGARDLVRGYRERLSTLIDYDAPTYEGYAGSAACKTCHPQQYETWSRTHHAHAYETIERIERHEHAQCYTCHVTGATARLRPGDRAAPAPAHLRDVGCEECHGAGAAHGRDPASQPMTAEPARSCRRCHLDTINPDFDFAAKLRIASCMGTRK